MPQKRNHQVDLLRGFGIICVVLGHCWMRSRTLFWVLYRFHMPLFFLLSGYVFSARRDFFPFLRAKARALLLPYVGFYLYSLAFTVLAFHPKESRRQLLESFFLAGKFLVRVRNWAIWYLPLFFLVCILGWILVRAKLVNLPVILLLFLVTPLWSDTFAQHFEKYFVPLALHALTAGLFFFCVGFYCRSKDISFAPLNGRWTQLILVLAVILAGYALSIGNHDQIISIRGPVFCLAALPIVWGIVRLTTGVSNSYLEYIGRNSLMVLGLHRPLLNFFQKVLPVEQTLKSLHIGGDVAAYLISFTTVALITALCLARDQLSARLRARRAA